MTGESRRRPRAIAGRSYRSYLDDWEENGLDYVRGEAAGEGARASVAALIGADRADIALIASVSAAAGLVAAHFGPARPGQDLLLQSLSGALYSEAMKSSTGIAASVS